MGIFQRRRAHGFEHFPRGVLSVSPSSCFCIMRWISFAAYISICLGPAACLCEPRFARSLPVSSPKAQIKTNLADDSLPVINDLQSVYGGTTGSSEVFTRHEIYPVTRKQKRVATLMFLRTLLTI